MLKYKVICPYCGCVAPLVSNVEVYGFKRGNGMIYYCKPCKAYVGAHDNGKPLGSPAKLALRRRRANLHKIFDSLWIKENGNKRFIRTMMYRALADYLNIPEKKAHIGMFNEDQCKIATEFIKKYYI